MTGHLPAFDGTDPLHAALWAVRRGWHIFPVDHPALTKCVGIGKYHDPRACEVNREKKRGKHPAVAWGRMAAQYGNDPDQVTHWFTGEPRNIGIACKPSGLLVVDEDKPGAFVRFAEAKGVAIPQTFTVSTGRGRHYYFTNPANLSNAPKEFKGHGVDIRGGGDREGGYVIAPGSLHSTGVIYTPDDPSAPVAECPEWLIEALGGWPEPPSAPEEPAASMDLSHDVFNQPGIRDHQRTPIRAGERYEALLAYAGRLRKSGLEYEEAEILFRARWELCEQPSGDERTWGESLPVLEDVFDRYAAGRDLNTDYDGEEDSPRRRVLFQPVSQIKRRRRQYLWENRLPLGEMTLWVGHAGIGKSQAAVWLASAVSNGTLPGELQGTPAPVLYLATEDSWEYTLAPRFDAAGGDSEAVYRIYSETEEGTEGTISLSVDLDGLREAIHQTGARLVVLDALLSTFGGAKLTEQGVVRRHMEPLARLAQELNIAVVGVAHFRKANDPNPLHMIAGSAEFGQVVRSAIGFAPDPEAEDGSCVLSVVKTNIAPKDTPSIRYRIEPGVVETEDGPTDVGRFVAVGETEQNVADLLNAERGSVEDRSERAEASEWLLSYLADNGGEAPAGDVIRDADKAGFTKDVVKKARRKAGVKSQKSGVKTGWVWVLDTTTDSDNEGARAPEGAGKVPKVPGARVAPSAPSGAPSGRTPEPPSLSAVENGATATCRTPGCGRRVALDMWPDGHCFDHQEAA